MMQRCSELGKNSATWQLLVRFDRNNLKVKKGPNGHYLESSCRDELRKSLPAKSFEELMTWVAKWLKRLDDLNGMVSPAVRSQQDSDKESKLFAEEEVKVEVLANPSVVDLCSDEEDEESVVRFPDKETLDAESVISTSSLMVLDDELGEVNLKDYADHVDGKLDEASLRKRNRREEDNTSFNANKQTSIKEFLTPNKTPKDKTPSPVFRRALKTYVRRPKLPASGEAGGQVLRELNVKDGTTSNTSFKEDKSSDLLVIDDLSQEVAASIEECHEKTEPKTPTDKEPNPSDIKIEVPNSNDLIEKETSASQDIKSKSDVLRSVAIKSEPEVHSEMNGEAKENNEPNAKSKSESEKPDTRLNEPPKQVEAKGIPLVKDLVSTDSEAHIEDTPNSNVTPEVPPQFPINTIRIRSDLVSSPVDTIRVRTDLLQQPSDPPPSRAPVDPSETSKAQGAAEKRRLTPEPAGNQCKSTDSSLHGQPKRSAVDSYNPTSVATSTYSSNVPAFTASYQVNGPPPTAPATTSTYPAPVLLPASPVSTLSRQPVVPPSPLAISTQSSAVAPTPVFNAAYPRPLSVVAPTVINSSYPVDPGRANSIWYPPPNHRPAAPVVTRPSTTPNYQPPPPAAPCTSSSYQPPPPPAPCTSSSYQRANPVPAVRASASSYRLILPRPGNTPRYPTQNSMAPAPATSTCYQPHIPAAPAPAPAPAASNNAHPTGCNRSPDLTNIMGMLAQVEFFAYGQKNQEAFDLVHQLRLSLQKKATSTRIANDHFS
ncbi:pollen-specific leucine-rich repeat extensin-like protein 1 [Drosophila teissieri]|uniref:pollen-specific leucine-rich repeat extensin-like protein 1 n=1 Tax=Drosophila teissieri TaxID=7243 RepID=UPI001CBA1139|nr:pollen-specific leucine-rich repeat extensin-like protein 1 [Drosophila teissieri]XP_043648116.1 pollen-specific leucine-rich repeat extensin-like protein 1 [Drosophila teissieri]